MLQRYLVDEPNIYTDIIYMHEKRGTTDGSVQVRPHTE
jgi:hypothetical protein